MLLGYAVTVNIEMILGGIVLLTVTDAVSGRSGLGDTDSWEKLHPGDGGYEPSPLHAHRPSRC